ncbi:MAG: hypothetical protein F6J87_16325 [Spirulina sp. SIO3F2]|nr:hypothetical protein [Spirulina sp. SIO3F2]
MIQRHLKISLALTPLFFTVGCGNLPFLGGDDGVVSDPAATPAPGTPAPAVPAAPAQADNADADFEDPLVESEQEPQKPADPKAASGLIPLASTDAAAKLAKPGRQDPFATIPISTEDLESKEGTQASTVLPKLPTLPVPPVFQLPPFEIGFPPPEPTPALPADISVPSDAPFSPELPPLPEPDIANTLVVTGVIMVKGIPHAIVEGPELKSTYVREGDYLLNGQVLVKRIEASKGGPAFVVFEELGIEVVKQVGEQAAGAQALPPEF